MNNCPANQIIRHWSSKCSGKNSFHREIKAVQPMTCLIVYYKNYLQSSLNTLLISFVVQVSWYWSLLTMPFFLVFSDKLQDVKLHWNYLEIHLKWVTVYDFLYLHIVALQVPLPQMYFNCCHSKDTHWFTFLAHYRNVVKKHMANKSVLQSLPLPLELLQFWLYLITWNPCQTHSENLQDPVKCFLGLKCPYFTFFFTLA